MLKKAVKFIVVLSILLFLYETFAFSTHLLKPLIVAPFVFHDDYSNTYQLWYQNITYLINSPKQTDIVLFRDQSGRSRVGVIETIISTESKTNPMYRIRLFLTGTRNYYLTIPRFSIVGKIFPLNKLTPQIKNDEYSEYLVDLNSIAPILQEIQKETDRISEFILWNKPMVNSREYLYFTAMNNQGYQILISHVPFIEFATTVDLSIETQLSKQTRQLINKVITDNNFVLIDKTDIMLNRQSFQFTNITHVCQGEVYLNPLALVPFNDLGSISSPGSGYWIVRLACVTNKEFEDADNLVKPFRDDFKADTDSPIFVHKISDNYALLYYKNSVIAQKINGHWKIVWVSNGIPQCSEMKRLNIPVDIYEECY